MEEDISDFNSAVSQVELMMESMKRRIEYTSVFKTDYVGTSFCS